MFELVALGLLGLESDSFAERQAAQARLARNPILAMIAKPAGPESEHAIQKAVDPWKAIWLEVQAATFVEAMLDEIVGSDCESDFVMLMPNSLCFEKLDIGFVNAVYTQWAERRGWYGLSRSWNGRGPDWGAAVMRYYWYVHHGRQDDGDQDPL